MQFVVSSQYTIDTIGSAIGKPEYSYYFVLREFLPLLETLGSVHIVDTPEKANGIYQVGRKKNEDTLFLQFTAPHGIARNIPCPTLPVFAWEFDSIPNEAWDGDGYNDWTLPLKNCGAAITHSEYTVKAVKEVLGESFPIVSLPAPVWDRHASLRNRLDNESTTRHLSSRILKFYGVVCDSHQLNTSPLAEKIFQEENPESDKDTEIEVEPEEHIEQILSIEAESEASVVSSKKTFRYRLGAAKRIGMEFYRECISDLLPHFIRRLIGFIVHSLRPIYRTVIPIVEPIENSHNEWSNESENSTTLHASETSGNDTVDSGEFQANKPPGQEEYTTDHEVDSTLELFESESEVSQAGTSSEKEEFESDREIDNILELSGVVYTSIFNPYDGRKNWEYMLSAFCWAFREVDDATLFIKVSANHIVQFTDSIVQYVDRLRPFKCRFVIVKAYLERDEFDQLIEATSYYVNTSYGEGQCLPLMEFLSCGIPAIAPNSTAMGDYMTKEIGFVVSSHEELTHWQHDPRQMLRTIHHQVDWRSLVDCFKRSYDLKKSCSIKYQEMSVSAVAHMKNHCSHDVIRSRLLDFLALPTVREIINKQVNSISNNQQRDLISDTDVVLYDAKLSGWYNDTNNEIISGFCIEQEDVVLDVGCGEGANSVFAAMRADSVIFCDINEKSLRVALERVKLGGVAKYLALLGSGENLGLHSNSATKIICSEVLEHADNPEKVMAELYRVGKPGARYMISVPDTLGERLQEFVAPGEYFEKPNHIRIFSRDQFELLVANSGLTIEDRIYTGFYHVFYWLLFWCTPKQDEYIHLWTRLWHELLKTEQGRKSKSALDKVIAKSQIIIARK